MAIFTKNEIVELKVKIKVGESIYPAGSRFVVTKANDADVHLNLLNKDNTINDKGISGAAASIQLRFTSTGTKYLAPKSASVEVKKGSFYTFKKEFSENGSTFPVGTRAVIVKGGKNPEIAIETMSGNVFTVNPLFITDFLEAAEAAKCDLSGDWKVKGLSMRQGQETPSFDFNLYYKGKKMGGASNDGYGDSHRVHVYGDEWEALKKAAFEICKAVDTSKSDKFSIQEHDAEEYLIDYFLDNHNGLSTLKDYLEQRVEYWCNAVSLHQAS